MSILAQELFGLSERHNSMNTDPSASRMLTAIFSGALLLAACGGSDLSSDAPATSVSSLPLVESLDKVGDSTTSSPATTEPGNEVPNDWVAQIVAIAAGGSGVSIDEVTVTLAEAVQWSDGSLGCPEPGAVYTQAIVDGFRIVVQTPSGDLDYRTSGTDFFVLCTSGLGR